MNFKMGRMTKRNRAKYRRRAYEAGMLRDPSGSPTMPSRPGRSIGGTPQCEDFRGRRVEPEVEDELTVARRDQRAHDAAERRA